MLNIINFEFLDYCIVFFQKVVEAKLRNRSISLDWYKKEFLSDSLPSEDIAVNAGLNKKTVFNMHQSARKDIVIKASFEHYNILKQTIEDLINDAQDLDITLTIKFQKVSVNLDISESLVLINALAVKRAALRGGLWSASGKQIEEILMKTLCILFKVPKKYYAVKTKGKVAKKSFQREVDFYLIRNRIKYKCEVKLMGRGNPESADAVIARDSKVFIADKLSNLNKKQLNKLNIGWVELFSNQRFMQFKKILKNLKIPHTPVTSVNGTLIKKSIKKAYIS